ncbi:MAG: hypothetical protein Q8R18_05660 [bacterium]|nr:hypothetical protein [bacterium]
MKIKYPKFLLLIFSFIGAYYLFQSKDLSAVHNVILNLGYLGTFLSGMFFSYGFSAAIGTVMFLILAKSQSIFLASIIGGLGALCTDLLIFNILRYSFADELRKLSKEKLVREMSKKTPHKIKKYLLLIVAGFIIASPLPDEIGVSLLAASRTVSQRMFIFIAFLLNTVGIFIIILLGKML